MQDMWKNGFSGFARGLDLPDADLAQHPGLTGGKDFMLGMLDECARSHPPKVTPRRPFFQRTRACPRKGLR